MTDPIPPPRRGRPRSEMAAAHAVILDAVYVLLQEMSVRDLTMEAVAKKAGVGKPTLYKWWPSKAALVFAMYHERFARWAPPPSTATVEAALRIRVRSAIGEFRSVFGKVLAELIAEGQSDPEVLRELYIEHISIQRAETMVDVERAKKTGEFRADTDAETLVDELIAPLYYRTLLRIEPLDEAYGDRLVDQVLRGVRAAQLPGRP